MATKMLRKLWISATLVFAVSLSNALEARGKDQSLVIRGGTLIDGTGRDPIGNAVVVVEGSRIKAAGPLGQISYPASAKVIDVDGKTILPGFIDSHIHLREWMLPMFLRYGVTTVYDTNNQTDWILLQREALRRGKIKGPRLFLTGMAVAGPGGASNDTNFLVETPGEARAFVKNMVAQGVDMIKTQETLARELLKAVLDEAAKEGVPVVGHTGNIREATQLGYKFMEHTKTLAHAILAEQDPKKLKEIEEQELPYPEYLMDTDLFDPLIQLMVKQGVYINPTFVAYWRVASPRASEWTDIALAITKDPTLGFVPADVRLSWSRPASGRGTNATKRPQQLAEGFKKIQEFTRRYVEAGGKVVAGSDSGYMPGLAMHFEMQSLVDAGVPPLKAILGATRWAAELLGKGKDLGTIEAGKMADLVVVEGNPLNDITTTQEVRLVMKDGEIVDTAYDPRFENPVPRPVNDQPGPSMGPSLFAVTPRIACEGDRSVTLQLVGEKFNRKSVVRFDTTDLQTRFVSDSKLTAVIDGRSLQNPGTYAITVVNPGSGGGTSNVVYFMVNFRY